MRAGLPFAALFGALALAAAPAEPLRLEWKVHAGCPDANAFWSALVFRVESSCRVTDHTGLDALASAARCKELFDIALDATPYDCGPNGGAPGAVRIRLADGTKLTRDLTADRCSVLIPSLPTHKLVIAAWSSAGGG